MPKKSKNAGSFHPATIGLEHYMRSVPSTRNTEVFRELSRTTGMNKLQMLEHIGNRVIQGKNPKSNTEELEAENRLAKLNTK